MPAGITTNNPLGIGYQTGIFSGPKGEPLAQHFFNAAFAGRINENKIYKKSYHCDIVGQCGISQWLEQWGNVSSDCFPEYSLIETFGDRKQMKISAGATVPQYPGTVALHVHDDDTFVGNQFVLPQVGNVLVSPPNGHLLVVTAISQASADDITVTVRQFDKTGNIGEFEVAAGDEFLVLSGAEIADCACPTGQFRVPDLPIITDLSMYLFGDKGEVCGDAVNKCQWLKIPFHDEEGNVVDHWYTEALQRMYRDHEEAKMYQRLFNPYWGLIPMVRARGFRWVPASNSAITLADVRTWKSELDLNGIMCREFAIFAGKNKYSQWQQMLLAEGVEALNYSDRPMNDCSWLNLEYCGIKVEGLKLHIYDECNFSNGKTLGSQNYVFPDSAIVVPLCNRPAMANRSSGTTRRDQGADLKMYETVYFKSNDGRVWDNLTDSNGIFGPRNTFGAGCEQHEWTIKSRFLCEPHCMNWWGFMGLY